MAKGTSQRAPVLDVLILHGRDRQLVDYLCSLCVSLGLTANYVENLPSNGMDLNQCVTHYASSARLRIILATFDEENKASNQARPNVIDELRLCAERKLTPTLLVVETRDGKRPALQSNLPNPFPSIEFSASEIHVFVPKLIKDLRSMLQVEMFESPATKRVVMGRELNSFLDKMDDIWDNEFDEAWKAIHQRDYAGEREFANELDQFFLCYHAAFVVFAKTPNDHAKLRTTFASELKSALEAAERAWKVVAQGRLRIAQQPDSTTAEKISNEANREFRLGAKARSTAEAISCFKKVVELLN